MASLADPVQLARLAVRTGQRLRRTCEQWSEAYRAAWQRYYTNEHIETILKRVASVGANASNALFLITWFKGSIDFEHIHPLESGFMRKKSRLDRRPTLPAEPVWRFYPRYWTEIATVQWVSLYLRLRRKYLAIKHDPNRTAYTDLAMTPVSDDEAETHELFQTDVAKAFIGHQQHVKSVQAGAEAAV